MKAKIIHYEGSEEIVDEEIDLEPEYIGAESISFGMSYPLGDAGEEGPDDLGTTVFETITFSRSPTEIIGYIHPLADGKFLFISEEEWAASLTK